MELSPLNDQIEEILRELGVEPPSEKVDDDYLCVMCRLGEYMVQVENIYLRQTIEAAAGDLPLAIALRAAQQHAVTGAAAVAMEFALANPALAEHLLSELSFDRDQTQLEAGTIKSAFTD